MVLLKETVIYSEVLDLSSDALNGTSGFLVGEVRVCFMCRKRGEKGIT